MSKKQFALAVAVAGLGAGQPALAVITVRVEPPLTLGSGFDRYDIWATSTGSDTGTQVKGLEFFYAGAGATFGVDDLGDGLGGDPDGIPDTANYLSAARTRVRVSTTAANNVFVGVTPNPNVQPNNPYLSPVTAFSGAIANTGTTYATGTGFQIARIFLPTGSTGVFSGNIGGDIGAKVPFSVSLNPIISDPFPVITPVPDTNIVFGSIVSNGAPFSVAVTITCAAPNAVLAIAAGPPPAGIRNLQVSGATGVSPRTFIVSGIIDYSLNGTTVVIPVSGTTDFGPSTSGAFRLIVTPEPTSIALLGLWAVGLKRRRA